MQLLKLESNLRAYPAPEIAEIEEFRALIRRDRGSPGDSQGRSKQRAARELAYIYHLNSHDSPYANYAPDIRREHIVRDLFPLDWNWSPDEILEAAEAKYRELTKTHLIRLLDAANLAVIKLTQYFENVSFEPQRIERDGQVFFEEADKAKEVIGNLGNMPKVIASLRTLREEVEREQSESARLKGGVKLNKYNE